MQLSGVFIIFLISSVSHAHSEWPNYFCASSKLNQVNSHGHSDWPLRNILKVHIAIVRGHVVLYLWKLRFFLLNIGLFSMWTNCYTMSVVSKWQTAIRSQTAGSIFPSRKECIKFKTSHWFMKVAFISGSQLLSYWSCIMFKWTAVKRYVELWIN